MSRRTELAIAGSAVGGTLLFTAAVFVWRIVYDDAPVSLPRFPRMERFEAFDIYSWLGPFLSIAMAVLLLIAAVRRSVRWTAPWLAAIVSFATAIVYLPFWFMRISRVDRLAGEVEEPVPILQALVALAMLTLFLSVMFLAVTRLRRTPDAVRHAALVVAMMVNAGLLHLFWVPSIEPFQSHPLNWARTDLLVAVRPCRGASLWVYVRRRFIRIATIDDVWLNFADPRHGKAPTFAVSAAGEWQSEYLWLNSSDLQPMRVRKDDPAVVRCDDRPRPERVAPAAWHKLGFEW